ncbi:2-oxo-4-hydroxy-4-carboxy-5-ureidoimidazoline decarboxylase [Pseudoroseomonas wenyumeiae]|uniref:2-oxo-4-hydroxy-4-carboxy-5-ureidoimidazoline decarboxylase n=1 Tax=Teichococcus wenyumeiae TaxID=2478470 RepID=A0ABX9VD89_9PROT|nr:2-oxo-4-hydroxy-4-carboxy-5-ureidoimidazoline decarboxylase [Pseudoroseomonas wenyumeiae]RMI15260.1 2-oxo-4-hydroxy-4-carboxy-5-ureidoimidazoline decarboxylase [Pseudoroseomonas wenyumeiae]
MTSLAALNAASAGDFATALEGIFERAPWVAAAAAGARPFASWQALHAALNRALESADEGARRAFLNGHEPLVAGPLPASLTVSSRLEQGDLPLGALIDAGALAALNAAYRQRFGFPFIIALRRRTAADVLREFRRRLATDAAAEWPTVLAEVGHVTRFRLLACLGEPVPAGSIVVELTRPARKAFGLHLLREGEIIARHWVPAGTGGPLRLWQEAPLRLGAYQLLVEGRPHAFRPERAEGVTTLLVRDPASG